MNYVEYGKENRDVIILLHGGGLSWWNYKEEAEMLMTDYRVILPILDGHARSANDFVTIEDNAARIIEFIDAQFGGSVLLIGGLSLGGQILLEMLSQREGICRYAIIESALVLPLKWMHLMIGPAFGSCYGLIRHRWFSKLQFKSLRIKQEFFEDYFRDSCGISKANMIAFLQANALYAIKDSIGNCSAKVYVYVGEKENCAMRNSAKKIHAKLRESSLQILPLMHHGEFSINHANDYAITVSDIVKGRYGSID